ncbi:MAG: bifunctional nuclease family protein [Firmicutes bacterium]|nr:bifunctional nuclease family protein [Bacillota bacterium]
MIEVNVKMVAMDRDHNYIVLLADKEEKLMLPIWIGPYEARAIAMPLENERPPRPMSHDLIKLCCEKMEGKIEKVVITDITPQGTYYAEIYLAYDDDRKIIDSRPSDAIALALRSDAPIYIMMKLVEFTLDPQNIIFERPDEEECH